MSVVQKRLRRFVGSPDRNWVSPRQTARRQRFELRLWKAASWVNVFAWVVLILSPVIFIWAISSP